MRILNYFLMEGLSRILPRGAAEALLRFVAVPYGRISGSLKNTRENLRQALSSDIEKRALSRIAEDNLRNFASALCDLCYTERLSESFIREKVATRGLERLNEALMKDRGAILATAHIGNWELGGMVSSRLGYSVTAVALAHTQKSVDGAFQKRRLSNDVRVILLGGSMRGCYNVLKKNEVLAMVGDILFGKDGIEAPFLGKTLKFPGGLARLSIATGAPIVPAFFVVESRNPTRYLLEIRQPIQGSTEGELTRAFVEEVETMIRRYPDQWYNFKKFWEPVVWQK